MATLRPATRVPNGMALKVFFWHAREVGEELQPRFVFGEYGGIQFDYGLDEGGHEGGKTLATPMSEWLWLELRRDYSAEGSTFAIDQATDIFVIRGKWRVMRQC